jgi:hypothetical protein
MLVRPTELEIPEGDPFQFDILGREKLEPPLTQFITQASGPFVLALDGSWGSGKTTFLKMWQAKLKESGHVCLFLNAWKTDFVEDPLVAVVGELSAAIDVYKLAGSKGTAIHRHMKEVRKVAESIIKRSIPAGIKLATLGMVDAQDITERVLSDFAASIAEDRIKDYEDGKSEIEEFRKTLASLAQQVASTRDDSLAKVVIIVDELDRCRPIYAVQLLERIKHLFDVPGLVFILGIDRAQLQHSICALYGTKFDARGYLKRFIDLDYRLPDPEPRNYCNFLFERFEIGAAISKRESNRRDSELVNLNSFLGCLMSAARMSLREQEQIIAKLRVVIQTIPTNQFLYPEALGILLFLSEWDYSTYLSLLQNQMTFEDIFSRLKNLPDMQKVEKDFDLLVAEIILLAGFSELGEKPFQVQKYEEDYKQSRDLDPKAHRKADFILRGLQELASPFKHGGSGFRITAERLALTKDFVISED